MRIAAFPVFDGEYAEDGLSAAFVVPESAPFFVCDHGEGPGSVHCDVSRIIAHTVRYADGIFSYATKNSVVISCQMRHPQSRIEHAVHELAEIKPDMHEAGFM